MINKGIRRLVYKMEDLKALETRVGKLEYVFGEGAEDTVRKIQHEMLQDLYRIKEAISEDLKHVGNPSSNDTAPLLEEIKKLREENEKLHYRISHMKRYID